MVRSGPYVVLRQELARDLDAVDVLWREMLDRLPSTLPDDPVTLAWAALTLHRIYTAIETMLERVASVFEGRPPQGPESHAALLRAASLDLPGVRSAILRESTVEALRPLLRFRHFVRHAYAISWDERKIADVIEAARAAVPEARRDFERFGAELEAIAKASAD